MVVIKYADKTRTSGANKVAKIIGTGLLIFSAVAILKSQINLESLISRVSSLVTLKPTISCPLLETKLNSPHRIDADNEGNIYVAEKIKDANIAKLYRNNGGGVCVQRTPDIAIDITDIQVEHMGSKEYLLVNSSDKETSVYDSNLNFVRRGVVPHNEKREDVYQGIDRVSTFTLPLIDRIKSTCGGPTILRVDNYNDIISVGRSCTIKREYQREEELFFFFTVTIDKVAYDSHFDTFGYFRFHQLQTPEGTIPNSLDDAIITPDGLYAVSKDRSYLMYAPLSEIFPN